MQAPPPMPEKAPNWFDRNWMWFVPVGCLGGAALLAGFLLAIATLVFGLIKSSDPYQEALARARAEASVVEALGEPIREGWFVTGNIKVNGPSGRADLAIPISGPKGKATVYAVAFKSAGEWSFQRLIVEIDEPRRRIELIPMPPTACAKHETCPGA